MSIRFFVVGLVVALVAVAVAGCASTVTSGSGGFSATDADKIVKGSTTKAQILSTFGQPEYMYTDPSNGNEIWSYSHSVGRGTVRPISFVPGVGQILGGNDTTATNQMLKITLAKSGVVKDYEYKEYQTSGSFSNVGGMSTRTIQTR